MQWDLLIIVKTAEHFCVVKRCSINKDFVIWSGIILVKCYGPMHC